MHPAKLTYFPAGWALSVSECRVIGTDCEIRAVVSELEFQVSTLVNSLDSHRVPLAFDL